MRPFSRLADERGAAAAEMALMVPLLVLLIFGAFEAGHFVWTQHKLVEAVRDGARFASRLQINDVCPDLASERVDEIKLLTRTGQLANDAARAKVVGWTDDQVSVEIACNAAGFVNTGMYRELGGDNGPVVTVSAVNVAYPSLFNGLGIIGSSIRLTATSNAPVIGL